MIFDVEEQPVVISASIPQNNIEAANRGKKGNIVITVLLCQKQAGRDDNPAD
jgi:hypothetical protein